jgi:hypothetical protein
LHIIHLQMRICLFPLYPNWLSSPVLPECQGSPASWRATDARNYKLRNEQQHCPFASMEPEILEATRYFKCLRPSASKQVKRSTRSCNLTIPSMYQKTSQIQQHSPSSTLWRWEEYD